MKPIWKNFNLSIGFNQNSNFIELQTERVKVN